MCIRDRRTEVTQLEEDIRQRMDTDIAEVTRKIGKAENSLTQLVAKKQIFPPG